MEEIIPLIYGCYSDLEYTVPVGGTMTDAEFGPQRVADAPAGDTHCSLGFFKHTHLQINRWQNSSGYRLILFLIKLKRLFKLSILS